MHNGLESSQGHYAVWKKPFQKVTYYMVPSIQPPHNDKFIVMERDLRYDFEIWSVLLKHWWIHIFC